ncbi:hypothetical protein FRB97_003102 [Tulasnella sp. 331]|nr:hypothetical protein FRB97_003102 [Tulasnella sp. 331]
MQSTSETTIKPGRERALSSSSSTVTTEVAKTSLFEFSSKRWKALKGLPYEIVPARREPSPASEVSSMVTLLTGKVSGFVIGAEHWGEEPTNVVKLEESYRPKEFRFATEGEELEARRKFGAAIVEESPWVPAPRLSNKRRKLSMIERVAASVGGTEPSLPTRRMSDPDLSDSFLTPSFPSYLQTSTPRVGRLAPASILKFSPVFHEAPSPSSSPPSSSQRFPMREPLSLKSAPAEAEVADVFRVGSRPTSQTFSSQAFSIRSAPAHDHREESRSPSHVTIAEGPEQKRSPSKSSDADLSRKTEGDKIGLTEYTTLSHDILNDIDRSAGLSTEEGREGDKRQSKNGSMPWKARSPSLSSTRTSESRAQDKELDDHLALEVATDLSVTIPFASPNKRQRDAPARRFQSLDQTQHQERSPRKVKRSGFSSSASEMGQYESQFDYDVSVDAIREIANADMEFLGD